MLKMAKLQTVQRIPLNTMTLSILTERVYTSQGVPISVVGTAQVCVTHLHVVRYMYSIYFTFLFSLLLRSSWSYCNPLSTTPLSLYPWCPFAVCSVAIVSIESCHLKISFFFGFENWNVCSFYIETENINNFLKIISVLKLNGKLLCHF